MLNKAILSFIRAYQHTLSPDHGIMKYRHPFGYCRYYPTCSDYMIQAITVFGFARGLGMGMWRLLRCHPWSRGGVDPVVRG